MKGRNDQKKKYNKLGKEFPNKMKHSKSSCFDAHGHDDCDSKSTSKEERNRENDRMMVCTEVRYA